MNILAVVLTSLTLLHSERPYNFGLSECNRVKQQTPES